VIDIREHITYCRHSLPYFARETLSGPPEAPYNGRFFVARHHEKWGDLVSLYQRLCVLAPRDHGKSYFFNFAYPIWKAVHQPGGCGFIFSATQPQAEKILEEIKAEIETNPKLQHLVPAKKNQWSARSIKLSNGHRIYARGFGTKVRGAHPNWIVVDDGLNDETMYSETVRKKQIDYFYSAIVNMIVPGGQIIVVGTPFHAADLYASLEANSEYHFKRYQAVSKKGKILWSERYNKELLEKKKSEIGSIRFAREFQCHPVSDAMSLFPGYLFEGDPTEQMAVRLALPYEFWHRLGVQIFMGVDFALSSSVEADYFVAWVMGKDRFGNRWIIDVVREKGLPYFRQLSIINTLARRYQPALIFLEANQMQRIFGDELIRKTDLPIHKFTTTAQEKNSLEKGVPGLRTLLENGKIRIPRGDARSVEIMDIFKREMQAFTWVNGKLQGLGANDDTVMAFWICNQAINQGAFEFTFGSEEDLALQEGEEADLIKELTGVSEDKLQPNIDSLDMEAEAMVPRETLSTEDKAEIEKILEAMEKRKTVGNLIDDVQEMPATTVVKKAPPKRRPVRQPVRKPTGRAPLPGVMPIPDLEKPPQTVNLVDEEEVFRPSPNRGFAVP
jgi:hypothetical protein